ncbi:MAG: hypothetical protein JXA94_05035 [Parachlamydiales bacterium]|nr:hypothetical protein [Parachlamydiales bacterium]
MSQGYTEEISAVGPSEENKSRRITGAYCSYLSPICDVGSIDFLKMPHRTFTGVKIEPTRTHEAFLEKPPTIPPIPSKNEKPALGYVLTKALHENEAAINEMIGIIIKNIKIENEVIINLSKEEQEKIQKHIEVLNTKYSVDVVKGILSCASSAVAIIAGTILAPQGVAGYLLITSGVLNILGNEIMPRTGGFEKLASFFTNDEKAQKDASWYMQVASNLASAAFSLTGYFAAGSLVSSLITSNNAIKVADVSLHLTNSVASYASKKTDQTLKLSEADKTKSKSQIEFHKGEFKTTLDNLDNSANFSADFTNSVRRSLNNLIMLGSKATQKE